MLAAINVRLSVMQVRISELWSSMFLQSQLPMLELRTWRVLPSNLHYWIVDIVRFVLPKLPVGSNQLGDIALALVLVCVPLLVAGLWLVNKKFRQALAETPRARRQLNCFVVCFSLAVGLFAYCYQGDYPEIWVVDVTAMILLARAIFCLAAGLRNQINNSDDKLLLGPIFWLYVLGDVSIMLEMPYVVVSISWAAGLLIALYALIRRLKIAPAGMEQRLVWASIWLAGISLLLTVMGFTGIALYLIVAWLIVAPGLQLLSCAHVYMKRQMQNDRWSPSAWLSGLTTGLGGPVLWFVFFAGSGLWISHQLGGTHLLSEAVTWNLTWQGVRLSASHLAAMVILFFVFKYIIHLIHLVLARATEWSRLDSGMVSSLQTIISYAMWTVFIYVVLRLFGLNLTSLLVIAGGMSVGVGFGLQNIVNNFVSGLILLFGRSVRPGDIIEVDTQTGRVLKVNIRSTMIQTFDNAVIMVPNSHLISNDLTNWTRNDRRVRLNIPVGVEYGSDAQAVEKVLLETAAQAGHVLSRPAPQVLFSEFADSALVFTLRVWIDNYDHRLTTASDLRTAMYQALSQAGITIAFPQLDVHLKDMTSISPDQPGRKSDDPAANSA